MEIEEGNALVEKAMKVILSCKTVDQLHIAMRYAGRVYSKLQREIGMINGTRFSPKIERSIGFAQCSIGHGVG